TITMSQTLSFNVTDPGDSPTYFFEGGGADDDESLPVELNYRFVAPGEWVVASAEGTNITINIVNGVTAEFLLPAGTSLPDVTITLEEQAPAPYDCEDAATHCISLNDDMTFTPNKLSVSKGDTVVFVWEGNADVHNVAEVNGANDIDYNDGFRSGNPTSDDGYWILPAEETAVGGALYYVCEPHAMMDMRGSITVGELPDDEGELLDEDSGLPGPGAVFAGAAIIGAALRRRR
ncbi:MAG: plastocyanin/azurin family copper-binding protein, partial [Candidatus Thermoplasmatota archaeon]|nr:plastocyanin/azurin family copper-binding protein [Candidatus Thermoplasmatota archaeon]